MGISMIKIATLQETKVVANLALLLWPDHTLEEMEQDMNHAIVNNHSIIFLAYHNNEAIGFAQCQLRYDDVEGTSSNPVGYLVGLFVKEEFRKQGFAQKMTRACEKWAKDNGCSEFASDCEIENEISLAMHLKLGFEEVNRIICFKKDL